MVDLAALVPKAETGAAIESLREEGIYDDTRRVRSHDDDTNELPIVSSPEETAVLGVIEQEDADVRVAGLDDVLRSRGFSDEELSRVPGSWSVVGDVILVRFPADCPRREAVAEALLDLQGADTVLARRGIEGETREPDVEVVAGSRDTETIHTEHGTKYALDPARVMFSPGNKEERVRMGQVVTDGERVLDMFAGIGYFALPMARAGAQVTATERNPVAFRYLVENAMLNEVADRLHTFLGDCRDVTDDLAAAGEGFERIVMGYYDAYEYLVAALPVLEPDGVLHVHEATPESLVPDRPIERIEAAVRDAGRSVDGLDWRTVKTHSEGVSHVVVDARIA